jgi:hypothetical protein
MKRALVIGIDDYSDSPLQGCVSDAKTITSLLSSNEDGSPNFATRMLTSRNTNVTTAVVTRAVEELFRSNAEVALFYFAGHGAVHREANAGHLVSQDFSRGAWGLSLETLFAMANSAHAKIRSTVIILDSCHAGFAGESSILGASSSVSILGPGVTVMAACQRDQYASEVEGRGVFTSIVADGLQGGAADVCGRITPASVYAHVDQTLGPWGQRPIYKANVESFVMLRSVKPRVDVSALRGLPDLFPSADAILSLDPSYEPNRGEYELRFKAIPVDPVNVAKYRTLQKFAQNGLVVPVDQEHMWHAAMHSTGCRLTMLGAHYRRLASDSRI